MRRTIVSKDSEYRRLSLNDWRRLKRQSIVNGNRGIDFDWLSSDPEDEPDSRPDACIDGRSLDLLCQYLMLSDVDDMSATMCLQNMKFYIRSGENSDSLCAQFVSTLSAFMAKPLISNQTRSAALDLIAEIINKVDISLYEELIAKSGLVLSIMTNFDTNQMNDEILTKAVIVMQGLTRNSRPLLLQALDKGYLWFLMRIIKSTQVFRQRKYTEISQSERLLQKKLTLIREISESLVSTTTAVNHQRTQIQDLYSMFEKLIHFKDKKIVDNAVVSLNIIVEQNPDSVLLLNRCLILSLTDLVSKNNENISSNVVHFWKLFNERIDDNIVNFFKSLLIETNLIKRLVDIVPNINSTRLVREVIVFLSEFIDKFSSSFELMIEFDAYISLMKLLIHSDSLNRMLVLSTIRRIVDQMASPQTLVYLFQIGIIETLTDLKVSDPNISDYCFQILSKIHLKSEQLNLNQEFFMRVNSHDLNFISFNS